MSSIVQDIVQANIFMRVWQIVCVQNLHKLRGSHDLVGIRPDGLMMVSYEAAIRCGMRWIDRCGKCLDL